MQDWVKKLKALGALMVAITVSACAGMQGSEQDKVNLALKQKAQQLEQYTLGPADVLTVNVWRNPDLSTSVPVRPDGKISSPLIGDVQAAGLTPEQLAA